MIRRARPRRWFFNWYALAGLVIACASGASMVYFIWFCWKYFLESGR